MRVLQVNSVPEQGSTGRIVQDIARELTRLGHESHVAYGRGQSTQSMATTFKIGKQAGVLHHVAITRLLDAHGLGSRRATNRLVDHIRGLAPDIIHLHNIHGYYVNFPLLFRALREWGGPVVWTLHDCWAFTGHCSYFEYVACDKWRTGCGGCPQLSSYPASWFVDRSSRNHEAKALATKSLPNLTLASPSRWLRDIVGQSFLGDYRCDVVPNDPDFTVFRPRKDGWRATHGLQGRHVLLGVANVWERRKGLSILLELAKLLRDDESLVVVGPLPAGVGLPPGVLHIPRTSDGLQLAAIYSAADVFVNPTLEDNYPTTNLEALACGTPVVTFDTGGAPETVARGRGVSVGQKTAPGLRAAIDSLRSQGPAEPGDVSLLSSGEVGMAGTYAALYQELSAR